jgi:hypothetical protein
MGRQHQQKKNSDEKSAMTERDCRTMRRIISKKITDELQQN